MRASPVYVATISLAISLAACSDSPTRAVEPTPRATHHLALCRPASGDAWFAYQNDGGAWKTPDGASFDILATDRLTVAVATPHIRDAGATGSLAIYRLTADQAQAMFDCASHTTWDLWSNKWTGVVSGLRGDTSALVTAGKANGWFATASRPAFSLGRTPDTVVDLLAVRFHYLADTKWEPDLMIARPGQRYPNGAALPSLNFDSSEAFPLLRNTLRVTDVPGALGFARYTPLQFQNVVRSATGEVTMSGGSLTPADPYVTPSAVATGIFTVPAAKQWAPLTHSVALWVFTPDATPPLSQIAETLYYRAPADRTVRFPPAVAAPTIVGPGASPFGHVRFEIPSQPEYDAVVDVGFFDGRGDHFELYATKEYFGATPASWSLSIPDLSTAPGFDAAWLPQPGPITWEITVKNRPAVPWKDGDAARQATLRGRQ